MLTDLCQELHNWFDLVHYSGRFEVTGGVLTASFLAPGQYYRIIGSVFNDGVHKYTGEADPDLTDEVWTGSVWALGIPRQLLTWQHRSNYGTTSMAVQIAPPCRHICLNRSAGIRTARAAPDLRIRLPLRAGKARSETNSTDGGNCNELA